MLKTFAFAALIAVSSALKLQTESSVEKMRLLNDYGSYEATTDQFETLKAGGEFTDPDFMPNDESLGKVSGDAARGSAGSSTSSV